MSGQELVLHPVGIYVFLYLGIFTYVYLGIYIYVYLDPSKKRHF
jgi:hypothetical protein